jgi:peptide/nickel transport system substrate-binding protein
VALSALAVVAVLTCVAVAATTAAAKQTAGSLVVNVATPPATLDPVQACSLDDIALISPMYVTLLRNGTKGAREDQNKIQGYLAKSWKVTNGGKTFTFDLNPNAKFPSGTPMDSAAVKYTFQRALDSGACGSYFATAGQGATLLKSIQTPSKTRVVVNLSRPEPLFIHSMTTPPMSIVDPSVVEANGGQEKGKPNTWMAGHSAGGGPFVLKSYDPGRQLVLTPNQSFFGPKPKVDQITVNFITSDPTLLLQARSGQADVTIGLTKKSVASLTRNSAVRIVATPAFSWQLISLPNKMPPFDNAKLREALSYAVPYAQIVQKVAYGFGTPFYGPYSPASSAFNPATGKARAFNVSKAKQLITASGVKTPIALDMIIRDGANDQEQIATIVQSTWKPLGINVTIKKLAGPEYANAIPAEKKTYSLIRFDGPGVEDPAWLLDYDLRAASPFNTSNMSIPKAEKLLDKAHVTTNDAVRQRLWDQIARLWVADSPRIPVYQDDYTVVLKKGVTGYKYFKLYFNMQDWSKAGS